MGDGAHTYMAMYTPPAASLLPGAPVNFECRRIRLLHGLDKFLIGAVLNVHQPVVRILPVEPALLGLINPLEPVIAEGLGKAFQPRDVVGIGFGARGLVGDFRPRAPRIGQSGIFGTKSKFGDHHRRRSS